MQTICSMGTQNMLIIVSISVASASDQKSSHQILNKPLKIQMNTEKEWNCPGIPEQVIAFSQKMKDRGATAPKFPQKLKSCLTFVENYPEYVNWVGICWYDHDKFACNVEFLARILSVKRNSINKNFSNFSFESLSNQPPMEYYKGYPLQNYKAWIIRSNSQIEFTMDSEMPTDIKPKKTFEISQFIDEFLDKLPDKNLSKALYDQIAKDDMWKRNAITQAISDWNQIITAIPDCNIQGVSEYMVKESAFTFTNPDNVASLVSDLLQNSLVSSQMMINVTFTDFFRVFLRFGNLKSIAINAYNLSDGIKFRQWFFPYTENKAARDIAATMNFVVKLSSSNPSNFSIVKIGAETRSIDSDPMADPDAMYGSEQYRCPRIIDVLDKLGLYTPTQMELSLPTGSLSQNSFSASLQFYGSQTMFPSQAGDLSNQADFDFGI